MTASSHDPEMEGLFGAYVLDALDPEERERVEAYLAQHPEARADVDEMQETTALLATAPLDVSASPPELWQKIVAEISTTTDAPHERDRRRRRGRRACGNAHACGDEHARAGSRWRSLPRLPSSSWRCKSSRSTTAWTTRTSLARPRSRPRSTAPRSSRRADRHADV